MKTTPAKRLAISVALIAGTSIGVAAATTSSGAEPKPSPSTSNTWTPNDCIRLNGGDHNACNVGNSGRGDLPYRPVHDSPTAGSR